MAHPAPNLNRPPDHPPDRPPPRRTVFVDFDDLEAKMSKRQHNAATQDDGDETTPRPRRILRRVDQQVEPVRANVKDAAAAIAQWVALVCDPQQPANPNNILSRCLRPGPDTQAVNCRALAREINQTLGTDLSAKRIRTAIRHLRRARTDAHQQQARDMNAPSLRERLDTLRDHLDQQRAALLAPATTGQQRKDHDTACRAVGTETLGVVRAAAGRVIDCDFGEAIPDQVDIDALEDRFLDFLKQTTKQADAAHPQATAASALHQFLLALHDYDSDAASDMRLTVCGAKAVTVLLGPNSLPGLMAQLNVIVAGRDLIDTDTYATQMHSIAAAATELHHDQATQTYLNWMRRQPKEQRLPSPIRLATYARNNLATRLLERVFTGDIESEHAAATDAVAQARQAIADIKASDSGFELLPVTEAILHTAQAPQDGSAAVLAYFQAMDESSALDLVERLYRYENNRDLAASVAHHAMSVHPAIRTQLIRVG